jgi:hypothetical protein
MKPPFKTWEMQGKEKPRFWYSRGRTMSYEIREQEIEAGSRSENIVYNVAI